MAIKTIFNRGWRKLTSSRLWKPFLIFVVGAIAGGLLVANWPQDKKSSSQSRSESSQSTKSKLSNEARVEQNKKNLSNTYEQAKTEINKAAQSGKLTADQAAQVTARLEEANKFMQEHASGSSEDREAIKQKRQEWREWAREQKISSIYLLRIYQ
jgi:hypothetical protein